MYTEGRVEFYTRCLRNCISVFHILSDIMCLMCVLARPALEGSRFPARTMSPSYSLPLHCMRFIAYIKGPSSERSGERGGRLKRTEGTAPWVAPTDSVENNLVPAARWPIVCSASEHESRQRHAHG